MPECVSNPKYAWIMAPVDLDLYLDRCKDERIAAKLSVESDDECPLLVSENITRLAKTKLLDMMAGITKIDGAAAAAMKLDDYDKLVDITLRLRAPFVKNVLTALRAA